MLDNKKLKVALATLGIGGTLFFSGCDDDIYRISVGRSIITYDAEEISGSITYADLENIKIVTFEKNNVIEKRLMVLHKGISGNLLTSDPYIQYIDLENREIVLEKTIAKEEQIIIGEDITIIEEQGLELPLIEADQFKPKYEINEIISFYHNLSVGESKQMVKKITK